MRNASKSVQLLELGRAPIAIGFFDSPPAGLARWDGGPVAAGCIFWEKAMRGQSFYTVPADHYNCAVGSYTHKIALPAQRAHELDDTITFMASTKYVASAEVPGIPTLARSPGAVAYRPMHGAGFKPDVVLIAAKPAQAMLIYEAAIKAGAGDAVTNALGRPACAVLPLTMTSGQTSISLGCKGNRTFTGLADEEMYVAVPGDKWQTVVEKLAEAREANVAMEKYYSDRKALWP
ncbi:MAG: DUF169 domain-containing protein [Proteobacteria bacterium]|nr:DUF169 domain-containing protein [Pseudomonadota bacterium]MDA0984020.1 DUF169 domain-containing protein [Pseudomonadota bacterium]